MRHKFELIFLEVSAKNKVHFFFKSLQEQNITSPFTGVSDTYRSYGSYWSSLGILKFFADALAVLSGCKPSSSDLFRSNCSELFGSNHSELFGSSLSDSNHTELFGSSLSGSTILMQIQSHQVCILWQRRPRQMCVQLLVRVLAMLVCVLAMLVCVLAMLVRVLATLVCVLVTLMYILSTLVEV